MSEESLTSKGKSSVGVSTKYSLRGESESVDRKRRKDSQVRSF